MSGNRYIGLEDIQNLNNNNNNPKKEKKVSNKKSIFERFSIKENIIIFSFILILLFIVWKFINAYNPYGEINYKNENLNTFLENSTIEHSRDVYWILNDIILSFLSSNENEVNIDDKEEGDKISLYFDYNIEEYYNALHEDYRKFLSKKEYLEVAKKLINNYSSNYEVLNTVSDEVPIRKVYKVNSLNGDYYLVRLNTTTDSYIGIQIYTKTSKYKIFYIE